MSTHTKVLNQFNFMGKRASWMPSFLGLAKSLVLDDGFYSLELAAV